MFSDSNNGYSLADLAAVTGNKNGFGDGNGSWLWILLVLLICGWNGNGFMGGGSNGAAENYVLASDFATLQRQIDTLGSDLKQSNTSIGNGIASLGYDQLAQINGIQSSIANSTYDIRNAIQSNAISDMQNTNAINSAITALGTQLASCCCNMTNTMNTQFGDLKYSLAEQSCATRQTVADAKSAIIENNNANTRSILDFLTQDKIASLTAENQALKFAASQQAQNAYLVSALAPTCCGCNS